VRRFLQGVLVPLGLAVGLLAFAPNAQATAEHRLAVAGIDAGSLKPGWTLDGENVVWDNGDAILSFGTAAASNTCASTYVCLYDNINFDDQNRDGVPDGAMIARLRGQGDHDLGWYGFDNKMSSWKNYAAVDAIWFYNYPTSGTSYCMSSGTSVANEWVDSDKVSALWIGKTNTVC